MKYLRECGKEVSQHESEQSGEDAEAFPFHRIRVMEYMAHFLQFIFFDNIIQLVCIITQDPTPGSRVVTHS